MSDAAALARLDELLDLDAAQRAQRMARLQSEDPVLHARLVKLMHAALADDFSNILHAPVRAAAREVRSSGQVVGGYRLLSEIGRGGMSVVWRAERADGMLRREIALKLPFLRASSAIELARFTREKDALAALSHPNIAQLHDAGFAEGGQPFIALELVQGTPLTAYCDEQGLDVRARLALFLEVSSAVEHAHLHLIVHRDLKPSNILVDRAGHVKLLDFGIAKLLGEGVPGVAGLPATEAGHLALTPRYAAPEQVTGKPVSTLTDVFVLGVLLHELLTGKLPYAQIVGDQPSPAEMILALARSEGSRPSAASLTDEAARRRGLTDARRLRDLLGGDLDTIVQKAMRRDPSDRYRSVVHLSEDIRRFLERRPIAARQPTMWHSLALLLARHRQASVVAVAGLLVSLALGLVALKESRDSRLYEERSVAVRDFMRDLVNDAEPNETQPDAPVAFIDMIGSAVHRARADFPSQPALQGELLSELGRMYWLLGQGDIGLPILEESVALLARHAPKDDPALNKARTYLASELLERNEIARARDLVTQAHAACTRDNKDCAKAHANALTLLSRLAFMDAEPAQAMELKRRALQQTIRAYGRTHAQTVLSMYGLANGARNTGQLTEAAATMAEAMEIAGKITMKRADRAALARTAAVLDNDLGRFAEAQARLTGLLSATSERAERALQLRLLALSLLGLGEPAEARTAADEAVALRLTTQVDREGLWARQARAQALALLEDHPAALSDIDEVLAGLRTVGYVEDTYEMLRARRIRAEVLLRAGRLADARAEIEAILQRHAALKEPLKMEWGLALDLAGCVLRESGSSREAKGLHDQARTHLMAQLPPDHPFLLRNTLYVEAASGNRESLAQHAQAYVRGLPAGSIWRQLLDVQSQARSCTEIGRRNCVFVL